MIKTHCGKRVMSCLFYLQEYEELANKIHEYQLREQRLQEQMSMGGGSPPASPPRDRTQIEEPLSPGAPLTPNNSNNNLRTLAVGQKSPQLATRSTNAHLKAYLPNSMVTTVGKDDSQALIILSFLFCVSQFMMAVRTVPAFD